MAKMRAALKLHLEQLTALSIEQLLENRYRKFRSLGAWRDQETEKVVRRRSKTQKV